MNYSKSLKIDNIKLTLLYIEKKNEKKFFSYTLYNSNFFLLQFCEMCIFVAHTTYISQTSYISHISLMQVI